jgi:hypothetical protein
MLEYRITITVGIHLSFCAALFPACPFAAMQPADSLECPLLRFSLTTAGPGEKIERPNQAVHPP